MKNKERLADDILQIIRNKKNMLQGKKINPQN